MLVPVIWFLPSTCLTLIAAKMPLQTLQLHLLPTDVLNSANFEYNIIELYVTACLLASCMFLWANLVVLARASILTLCLVMWWCSLARTLDVGANDGNSMR